MSESMYSSSDDLNFMPNITHVFENDLNSGQVIRVMKPESDVGISSLPDRYVERLFSRQQYSFNVMLLGPTGVGKSTLIDSIFKTKFTDESTRSHSLSKVDIISNFYDLEENRIKLRLGVIEVKGFGDQIARDESFKPIVEYIEQQFDKQLEEELRIERSQEWTDSRVDACLYLISPVGHGLKSIDLVTMKALDTKVNLIPVIAKSDLITRPEMIELKSKIMSEIESNSINIYHFPTDDKSEVSEMNAKTNSNFPFAVVASNEFVLIDGQEVRARQYPWGTVEVENETHSELKSLREMILRTNLNELKETTHSLHYQHYRSQRLEQYWSDKQKQHLTQMKLKERLLIDNFTIRLRAKESELKKSEKELHKRFELLSKERIEEKMRLDLDKQRLEEEIKALDIRKQLMFGRKNNGHHYSTDRKPPTNPKSKTK